MDLLVHWYESIWPPLRWIINTLFSVIVVRGIIANEILLEIKQRGFLKDGMLHDMIKKFTNSEIIARKVAIYTHFKHGHQHDSVVGCTEENCNLFTERTSPQAITA